MGSYILSLRSRCPWSFAIYFLSEWLKSHKWTRSIKSIFLPLSCAQLVVGLKPVLMYRLLKRLFPSNAIKKSGGYNRDRINLDSEKWFATACVHGCIKLQRLHAPNTDDDTNDACRWQPTVYIRGLIMTAIRSESWDRLEGFLLKDAYLCNITHKVCTLRNPGIYG